MTRRVLTTSIPIKSDWVALSTKIAIRHIPWFAALRRIVALFGGKKAADAPPKAGQKKTVAPSKAGQKKTVAPSKGMGR